MTQRNFCFFCLFTLLSVGSFNAQQIAVLQYEGGGDWYANPTALPNLIRFCNENIQTTLDPAPATISSTDAGIMQYPFVHMTGHGNVYFSAEAITNLRNYLESGGFLHIDDNYGMDKYLRPELKKLFPREELFELSADHPVFSSAFQFPKGLPKIHEHDGLAPRAFGIVKEGRLVLLYTTETDLGDGWENPEIHNDPEPIRTKALQMGANILAYAFKN